MYLRCTTFLDNLGSLDQLTLLFPADAAWCAAVKDGAASVLQIFLGSEGKVGQVVYFYSSQAEVVEESESLSVVAVGTAFLILP